MKSNTDTWAAIHEALKIANLEYAAFSCNGVNVFGDAESIRAAAVAFHSHAQIDEFRTQIRHWREECGKLHARLDAQASATERSDDR